MSYAIWGDNAPPPQEPETTQNCRIRHRALSYRLLVEGVGRFPKQIINLLRCFH